MWKPVAARIGAATSPAFRLNTVSASTVGSSVPLRQPKRAARQCGLTVGIGNGELREVLAALGALVDVVRLLLRCFQLGGRGLLRHGDQDVRHIIFGARGRVMRLAVQVLIDFRAA